MTAILWAVLAGVIALFLGSTFLFRKVPFGKVMILRGPLRRKDGRDYSIVSGKKALVIPGMDECHCLSTDVYTRDIDLKEVPTMDPIPDFGLNVKAVAQFRISSFNDRVHNAVEHLLGKDEEVVQDMALEIIGKAMRDTISKNYLYHINEERDAVGEEVSRLADKGLASIGMEMKAFVMKELSDDLGYLDTMGMARTMEIKMRIGIPLEFITEPTRSIKTRWMEPPEVTADRTFKMGLCHLENGNVRSALRCFEQTYNYDPDDPDYFRMYRETFSATMEDFKESGYRVFGSDDHGFVIVDPNQSHAGDDLKPSDFDSYSIERKGAFLLALESSILRRRGEYPIVSKEFNRLALELYPGAQEDVRRYCMEQDNQFLSGL